MTNYPNNAADLVNESKSNTSVESDNRTNLGDTFSNQTPNKVGNYPTDGVTQLGIAKISGMSGPSVSRYMSAHKEIEPLPTGGARIKLRYAVPDVRKISKGILGTNFISVNKKRHAFYNFKGGTGKTSMCFQVASHLALKGYNVLVIDADPQAHLSSSLGFMQYEGVTMYDVIVNNVNVEDAVQFVFEGLDCIPSNLSLTRLEAELAQMPKREEQFKFVLNKIEKKYDFVLVDTNPTISSLNRNVISYADILEIVCETQPYSLNGLRILMDDLNKFYKMMNTEMCAINIIPNKYEDKATNSMEAMTALRAYYGEYVKDDFAISKSEDIVSAAKFGKPLAFFAKKNSVAFNDVIELCNYIIEISK